MKKTCVAIITARGGSKRIPRKNIREFVGMPIMAYSIQAALDSKIFDEVMVSTDDGEIAEIGKNYGAKIPFMRSPETSNDHATTADVIQEVLNSYSKIGQKFDYFCCIYPTAPFVTGDRLAKAFELLQSSKADTLIPVVRFGYPIQRALRLKEGRLSMIQPQHMNSRSQDLEPGFHDCGQFYFGQVEPFLKSKKLFAENTVALEIPELEVQDIDNEQDWQIAELKFRLRSQSKK